MKEEDIRKIYEDAYALLENVTPMPFDCGMVCGAACCNAEDEDAGIFLLPGEEVMQERESGDFAWEEISKSNWFLRCMRTDNCNRQKRPIQCRTFPLMPIINESGELEIIVNDMELPYACPLIESEADMSEEFYEAVRAAWERLTEIPEVKEYLKESSRQRMEG